MAVYKVGSPTISPRQHRLRQLSISLLVIGEIVALFFVLFAIYKRDTASLIAVEGTAINGGYYDPNPLQTTDDFTFRAPNNWSLDKRESTPGHYVYKAYKGELVTQMLDIYVNQPLKESRVTFLQPVTANGSSLMLGKLSDHCSKLTSKDTIISHEGAQFNCWSQNGQAFLGVGIVGGGSSITLKTDSGQTKTYAFRFIDSRYSPSFNDISNILKSFKAK